MDSQSTSERWQAIRIFGEGVQPATARVWDCDLAWDVTAVHREPDGELPHPDHHRAQAGLPGEHPHKDTKTFLFWNRHIDRRFRIEYRHATKDSPRAVGKTIGDAGREWDAVIEYQDRYLAKAGLTRNSPTKQVVRALADSFRFEHFKERILCPTFPVDSRMLNNAVEGLLFQSHCSGCAFAMVVLADVLGLPARAIGCGGHIVAEVQVDGQWHLIDSAGRHPPGNLDAFFEGSYHDTYLNPMGEFAPRMTDGFHKGLWRRPNGQFHFHGGTWQGPQTERWAACNAFAIYPKNTRWGFKSVDGKRMPLVSRAGGFYWPVVHHSSHAEPIQCLRRTALPNSMFDTGGTRDYLYHAFQAGQQLRQSIWLDDLADVEAIELTLTFGPSRDSDFSDAAGRQLMIRVGDLEKSLADLGAWPPKPASSDPAVQPDAWRCKVVLAPDLFASCGVNWIQLLHKGRGVYHIPCVPAAMQPYIPPLSVS